jgi:membrane protein implicated in regulation of membrane protease activity
MKKQKNNYLLLTISAIIAGITTFTLVKNDVPLKVQFIPYAIYALVLVGFFAKQIQRHYYKWISLFSSLSKICLLTVFTMFVLFCFFPAEGMVPSQWDFLTATKLLSINASIALLASLTIASVLYVMPFRKHNDTLQEPSTS